MKFKFYALKLSGLIILVFLMQIFISGFSDLFILNQESFIQFWRFLTAIFLHGGLGHLLYNLFALAFFGSILESIVGGRKFLIIFFVTGILANLISVNFYPASLGASGAIFGVIGALMFIRPMQVVFAFGLPMPIFIAGFFWAVGDIIGAIGFFTGNPMDNTGNLAHLSGMFFGFLFGIFLRKKRQKKQKMYLDERNIRNWEKGWLG